MPLPTFTYTHGEEVTFRIGLSEREVGSAANAPEGFTVYCMGTGKLFTVVNGVWQLTPGPIDPDILELWRLS